MATHDSPYKVPVQGHIYSNTANSLLQDGEDYESESLFGSKHLALKLRQ
jgi:hypothetical protein